jgi:hypothetical protein
MAIILAGRELGLPPMTALRSIHLVEGRVTLAADLQLALVKRAGVKHRWLRTDAEAATVELTRGADQPFAFTYSIEDAKRAGLAGKQNWQRHTPAMLRARAISAAIRAYCPDVLTGVYDPDELDSGADRISPEISDEIPRVVEIEPAPNGSEDLGGYNRSAPAPTAQPEAPTLDAPEGVVEDPSWAPASLNWTQKLRQLGITLAEYEAFCVASNPPRGLPRERGDLYRQSVLDAMARGTKSRAKFDEWLNARKAAAKAGGAA